MPCLITTRPTRSLACRHPAGLQEEGGRRRPKPDDHGGAGGQPECARVHVGAAQEEAVRGPGVCMTQGSSGAWSGGGSWTVISDERVQYTIYTSRSVPKSIFVPIIAKDCANYRLLMLMGLQTLLLMPISVQICTSAYVPRASTRVAPQDAYNNNISTAVQLLYSLKI